ncbi:MAG: 4Fe-4S dicluster domain-containing protein [Deltaproteobacteria bacterium]|nr:4Fe-4S dicluster domain-containing protein [Deltaproteobacteria bacterium]MBW2153653.1 4Fe-4S dicluster domain-containing protein [Deltaproteobacteria bacterium]
MAYLTTVDRRKCSGCEECLEACTSEVFEIRDGKAEAVRDEDCVGCESCVEVCKEGAITVTDTEVELSETALSLLKDIL